MRYPQNNYHRQRDPRPRFAASDGADSRPSIAHELRRIANALEELTALARKEAAR